MQNDEITTSTPKIPTTVLAVVIGSTVFVSKTEKFWDKSYVMKRHHSYNTRTVILRCKVIDVKGDELKGQLYDNNGFDKDGETFVFHKNNLLVNQDFKNFKSLGVWKVD